MKEKGGPMDRPMGESLWAGLEAGLLVGPMGRLIG